MRAFSFVLAVTLTAALGVQLLHPPHVERPTADAPEPSATAPLAVVGVVTEDALAPAIEFVRGIVEEEQRMDRARQDASRRMAPVGSPQACGGFPEWFPHWIIWRESNCIRGLDTNNGYRSAYQIWDRHWFGGICDGLTWTDPAQEDECADRLSQHGTRLGPWGA